ncbi:MAG: serine hydrolase [Rheinheimera sp.]|uniref:class A beta-lactamase-related serine hydrolase n=1 Tax=Arsukibacterium sp. UBA3155 TaxID=1946058 RepID=UPI000C8BCA3D|nr:class A beta-lactamase-related serine hydrolase [Arsukibacterium sp. UBA3155]MAD77423.1 serine hydrolase [Rheinheimera sp.]|tara:strand:+ start:846 stop:2333 length:1488 start_codon:yes stop_codon:yes gene_type:complete
MTLLNTVSRHLFFAAVLLATSPFAAATDTRIQDMSLHDELAQQDALFFQRGFNECDIAYLDATVSPELRFYHDKSGFQNKALFMQNTQKYICGDMANKPIRKLAADSLSTFPLHRDGILYGAVQHGQHQFYLREAGKPDQLTGTARFTSVWLKAGDDWQLSDVLSYDHQPAEVVNSNIQAAAIISLLHQNKVPALGLGIIEHGKLLSTQVYGELTPDTTAPQNTLFKVASLTKPVVTMLTLRLVNAGKLQLDEPLADYWVDPDLKADPKHLLLTPRIVLTHQTGFANWRYLETDNRLRFQFKPGTQHQYSGEGFEYLRRALEHKFGQSLEALAQQYVFEPAGMTDTYFWWSQGVNEHRYARNHDSNGKAFETERYYKANAAANLISTVDDYSKFMVFVMAQQQAMPAVYQDMQAHHVGIGPQHYFGLGWEIFSGFPGEQSLLLHSGRDPGVSTLAVFSPQSQNGYVIFMNGDNATAVLEQLLPQLYLGAELWQRN